MKTKKGLTTWKGLSCGAGDKYTYKNIDLVLYLDGCLHVKAIGASLWTSFDTDKLALARHYFARVKRALRRGEDIKQVPIQPCECIQCGRVMDNYYSAKVSCNKCHDNMLKISELTTSQAILSFFQGEV